MSDPAETVRETVHVAGRDFVIERPESDPDFRAGDDVPYWSQVWPASRMLAKLVLREPWPGPLRVLEIACGLGVAGLAALARGHHITFTDRVAESTMYAAQNARRNGFTTYDAKELDVYAPYRGEPFDLILGADMLYESRLAEPVAAFLAAALAPGGLALIADPDRASAAGFAAALEAAGFSVRREFARAGEPGGGRTKGTIYRITRGG